MKAKAIVYTSNTGSTAHYAELLGEEIGLPVYSMKEAKGQVPAKEEIIYLGWVMAGKVKGYEDAARRYHPLAVCAVGMGKTGAPSAEARAASNVPASVPLFILQGGFHFDKLSGLNKVAMNIMIKTAGKALSEKQDRTADEDDMLDMMMNGGDRVSKENLKDFLEWYAEQD